MVSAEDSADRTLKSVFGMIGSIGSVLLLCFLLFEVWVIRLQRNTIRHSPLNALGIVLSGCLTIEYGLETSEMNFSFFANITCVVLALIHLGFYSWYTSFRREATTAIAAILSIGPLGIYLYMHFTATPMFGYDPTLESWLRHVIAVDTVCCTIIAFLIPFAIALVDIYYRRAIKSISLVTSAASGFICYIWIIYATIDDLDVITLIPNAVGLIASVIEMCLLRHLNQVDTSEHEEERLEGSTLEPEEERLEGLSRQFEAVVFEEEIDGVVLQRYKFI